MRILLTGGSGMVGKNILEHEFSSKYEIFAPSSKELNLLDPISIGQYIKSKQIDFIIHCAGYVGGIHANIAHPVEFLSMNLLMGINLVNVAYNCGIHNLINLGSSCMYPKDYMNPLKEEYILHAPLEPTNEGYALAKITVAKLCEYMNKQYSVSYKTLIPCNLYGRHDKFSEQNSHMIPAVIKKIHQAKLENHQSVEIWGSGEARREFMYAGDCADGVFFAINNFDKLDDYTNLGLGCDYSVSDYYTTIANIIGYQGDFVHDLSKPVGMQQKLVDITKLENLGWIAPTSLSDGIIATYEFYKEVM